MKKSQPATMIQDCEILNTSHISTVKAKKTFKLKVLQQSPETVIANFTMSEKGKIKSNFLFFTHNPKAWH